MTQANISTDDSVQIRIFAQTDVGMVRQGNEDNFLAVNLTSSVYWTADHPSPPPELLGFAQGEHGALFAVSDGMGGALAGEVASQMAVTTVRDGMMRFQNNPEFQSFPFPERLRFAVERANVVINHKSQTTPEYAGMGATFTGAGIQGNRLFLAQIGDSRAYLIRRGHISQLTTDQSLVEQLIQSNHISRAEAENHPYKNVILQALGATPNVVVAMNSVPVCRDDVVLLCSDGLSGKINGEEMLEIFNAVRGDLSLACQEMIRAANERGGEDNITVMLLHFTGNGVPLPDGDGTHQIEDLERDARLPLPTEVDAFTSGDEATLTDEGTPTQELVAVDAASAKAEGEATRAESSLTGGLGLTRQMTAVAPPTASATPASMAASASSSGGSSSRKFGMIAASILIVLTACALVFAFFNRKAPTAAESPPKTGTPKPSATPSPATPAPAPAPASNNHPNDPNH